MLISNSLKCIFVHIHKCAGTSVELALDKHLAWNDLLLGSTEAGMLIQAGYQQRFGLGKHSSAAEIQHVVGEEIWRDYFTFAFVRHPCDRLVSLYEYIRTVRDDWARVLPPKGILKRTPFKKNLIASKLALADVPDSEPWNWSAMKALLTTDGFSEFIRSDYLNDDLGTRPQVMSIYDPVTGQQLVDFIGKLESINRDWAFVCSRLGIPLAALGRHNTSTTRESTDWRDWYTSLDIDFVREKYDPDFRALEYEI